jgi:WD40 repeat protein
MVTKGSFHTAGCWSPSRAGVCFIGKSNGTIDIWDFMDQSHKWTMQYSVGSIGISSMKFHEQSQNILAVGSQEGTLHILELPFTLVRKVGDEDKTMNEYWDREIDSVKYFNRRL